MTDIEVNRILLDDIRVDDKDVTIFGVDDATAMNVSEAREVFGRLL